MRILHTGDWHLADRLGRQDRTLDLRRNVERIADYCLQEQVDVLLIAGDLFSELASAEALRDTIRHLQSTFSPFLLQGGSIVALTGNHDKENFCQTLRLAMSLAAPISDVPGEVLPSGRLYLATEPSLLRLQDARSGLPVQFLLMPYPTPTRYLSDQPSQRYQGIDEKNRNLMAAFTQQLHSLHQSEYFSEELPAILAAHIAVRSCELSTLFRLSEQEDIMMDDAQLPTGFAYTALGHIHRAQCIGGQPHIRYSGSIESMDLGEKNDEKSVVLFDLGPVGIDGEPWLLPLESTPIYEVIIEHPGKEIPRLRQQYPNAARDLVRIRCTYTAGVDNREETLRQLEEIFPRWYDRQITEANILRETLTIGEPNRQKSFAQTVRDYLDQELTNHPDHLRQAVLERAEALIQELEASE